MVSGDKIYIVLDDEDTFALADNCKLYVVPAEKNADFDDADDVRAAASAMAWLTDSLKPGFPNEAT